MTIMDVASFAAGHWISPGTGARNIASAITGDIIASAGNDDLDVQAMLDHARNVGGPALRRMTFHQRAKMLKALAAYLGDYKQSLYDLSFDTGATQRDHLIDIDGGIGTMFVFASKGRREMPDGQILLDGPVEQLSRNGTFLGQHVHTPMQGVAVHINAYNFPVWGMLEKLAPTLLAGMPAIVKPATSSCYVTEHCVRLMLNAGLLPEGALQLVSGQLGDMLDRLDFRDVVSFTGSAATAARLRSSQHLVDNSVRFTAEQDSLNAAILGSDAIPGTSEFEIFIKEVVRELSTKAGQKCTAMRRLIVPQSRIGPVIDTLCLRLEKLVVGDPRLEKTRMGPLISREQRQDVIAKSHSLLAESERILGQIQGFHVAGADADRGAFLPPILHYCPQPDRAQRVHDTEAFGPVATIMGYSGTDHAIALANKGGGSLVASVFTRDRMLARDFVMDAGACHGRIYFNNDISKAEATGHGSPLPHMVHGGPGRAGGGEELGGIRGVKHYMQRTALQGDPEILTAIGGQWVPGADEFVDRDHPFTRRFGDLDIGDTLRTGSRTVTLDDIEHFARFTGDTFYAHMNHDAAQRNPFFPGRVAHGYLLLSFAAGLFVQPDEGPVLANTGLDNLRFLTPVEPGDSIAVRLTVKNKTARKNDYGEVRWHVTLTNQTADTVAEYDLLTMVAH